MIYNAPSCAKTIAYKFQVKFSNGSRLKIKSFGIKASRFVFEQMGENWPCFPRDEIYSAMEPAPCLSLSFIGCWCWPSERTFCLRLFLRGEQKGVVLGLGLLRTIHSPFCSLTNISTEVNLVILHEKHFFYPHTYSTGQSCPTAALYYTTIFCSVDVYQLFIYSSIDVF